MFYAANTSAKMRRSLSGSSSALDLDASVGVSVLVSAMTKGDSSVSKQTNRRGLMYMYLFM